MTNRLQSENRPACELQFGSLQMQKSLFEIHSNWHNYIFFPSFLNLVNKSKREAGSSFSLDSRAECQTGTVGEGKVKPCKKRGTMWLAKTSVFWELCVLKVLVTSPNLKKKKAAWFPQASDFILPWPASQQDALGCKCHTALWLMPFHGRMLTDVPLQHPPPPLSLLLLWITTILIIIIIIWSSLSSTIVTRR